MISYKSRRYSLLDYETRVPRLVFEEVKYESRNKLLKPRAKDTCPLKPHIFFKTYRNPLFDGVNLKDVILSNIENDFDVTVCFKGTPPLSETVCHKF